MFVLLQNTWMRSDIVGSVSVDQCSDYILVIVKDIDSKLIDEFTFFNCDYNMDDVIDIIGTFLNDIEEITINMMGGNCEL